MQTVGKRSNKVSGFMVEKTGKSEEFKAVVSAEFSSERAADAALKSLGSEREMEGRAKVKVHREGKEIVIDVQAPDAPSCRAALNGMLRLVELLKPIDQGG